MATNIGSNVIKGVSVGSNIIARAYRGATKIYDQLDYPTLDLNFALTKSLDPRITFTRASSGSYFDANGNIQIASTNTPRFDHNPVTGESLGLLIEEQRTNLLLNSTTLSTQSVTVTNVAHTLSFYGTGTIVLSGAHSATVNGSGVFPTRTILTFTPSAGSLTLTVSGTVQYAQLGVGNFATSWIPTTGATATRAADVATVTGTNFSSWYNQSEGTFFVDINSAQNSASNFAISCNDNTANNRFSLFLESSPNLRALMLRNTLGAGLLSTATANTYSLGRNKLAIGYSTGASLILNNGSVVISASYNAPAVSQLQLGNQFGTSFLNGHLRRIAYFNRRLPSSELQLLTA